MDWNTMAGPWLRIEAETDAAHAPVLDGILQRAGLGTGQSVLDIGPGAGISLLRAARAVGPAGRVTGIEIAPPFAERARARVPDHVSVVVADAQDHDFAGENHDAAISLFGMMFFRDSVAGFANIRRGLKPGAALTFACWGPAAQNPWFSMAARVASEVFGPGQAFDPDGPGPMRFGDVTKLRNTLADAGWASEIETVDLQLTPVGTPEQIAQMHMTIGAAATRSRAAKEAGTLDDAQSDAVRARLTEGFAGMVQDGAVRVPANIHFVRAIA